MLSGITSLRFFNFQLTLVKVAQNYTPVVCERYDELTFMLYVIIIKYDFQKSCHWISSSLAKGCDPVRRRSRVDRKPWLAKMLDFGNIFFLRVQKKTVALAPNQ